MSRFITNQGDLLKELLKDYIPQSKRLDFLAGYFYFTGFHGIYKEIGDEHLRTLIGMEADADVRSAIRFTSMISVIEEARKYGAGVLRQNGGALECTVENLTAY